MTIQYNSNKHIIKLELEKIKLKNIIDKLFDLIDDILGEFPQCLIEESTNPVNILIKTRLRPLHDEYRDICLAYFDES